MVARSRRTLSPLLALIAFAGSSRAVAAPDPDAAFRAWASGYAAHEKLQLAFWGPAHLDDTKGAQRVAILVGTAGDGEASAPFVVLVEDGPRRWTRHTEEENSVTVSGPPRCDGADVQAGKHDVPWTPWPCATLRIGAGGVGSHGWSEDELALRGGSWAVVRQTIGYEEAGTERDYDQLTETPVSDDGHALDAPHSLLLSFVPGEARAARTRGAAPIAGGRRWSGAGDADLDVFAEMSGNVLHLRLVTRDDVRVPVPPAASDKAFVGADHVELWFVCAECAARADGPAGLDPRAFQLGIGAREDGSLDVRWLAPEKSGQALPEIRGTLARLDVTVPTWAQPTASTDPRAKVKWELACAYSDADGPELHQDSLVALAPFQWGRRETFGGPVQRPGLARYPNPEPAFELVPAAPRP
jgi:hypothetical protein